jgi:hypothetical protein
VLQLFYNAKSVFLVVNASLCWLNNVSDEYLVQVSLLLFGQQGLEHFFRYQPLLPIGWMILLILSNAKEKRIIQHQPLLVKYKQHANPLLSKNNFTPLVISRNDKNKQLTFLTRIAPIYT